jgi:hypothetical protein
MASTEMADKVGMVSNRFIFDDARQKQRCKLTGNKQEIPACPASASGLWQLASAFCLKILDVSITQPMHGSNSI